MKVKTLTRSLIRVGVIEPHNLLREGLVALLDSAEGFDCVGGWSTESQLPEALCSVKPDVLLVGMSSEVSSASLSLLHFARSAPTMQIVALVECPKNCRCDRTFDAASPDDHSGDIEDKGAKWVTQDQAAHNQCACIARDFPARAVIGKKVSFSILSCAIRAVHQARDSYKDRLTAPGAGFLGESTAETFDDGSVLSLLSSREREVTLLVARGFANKEISSRLGVSYSTVKNHISRILQKLNLDHRTQLAIYAISRGAANDAQAAFENNRFLKQ